VDAVKQVSHYHVIKTKKQLATIVSGARQEIVDVLSQMETPSVAELATALGRPADAIYYHLRILQRAGLVACAGSRNHGKRQEQLFRTISPDLRLEYQIGKRGNAREITAIVCSMLRLGGRDFRDAFQGGDAKVTGHCRELWALRTTGWLKPEEVVKLNRSISSLARAVSKPRRKGRLYGITVLLTPLDHRARRTGAKVVPHAGK
jgi:DNA-binding transcriptional ArsR family regulator